MTNKRAGGCCIRCGSIPLPARQRVASGWRTLLWCSKCQRGAFGGDSWLPNRPDLMDLPDVTVDASLEPCAVCKETAALECHHLAPRELFGDDAERWPTVQVCRPCHMHWHHIVNSARRGAT